MTITKSYKGPLVQLYENMAKGVYVPIEMAHSDAHYTLTALQSEDWQLQEDTRSEEVKLAARNMTVEEINRVMYEEGLLPYYEYGIPRWFAQKYFGEGQRKRKRSAKGRSAKAGAEKR